MQIAVIEFARNVLGKEGANSTEFDASTRNPAVVFMPEGSTTHKVGLRSEGRRQHMHVLLDAWPSVFSLPIPLLSAPHSHSRSPRPQGGTMRLGSRRTILQTVNCTAAKLYQQDAYIDERHRHR